MTAPADNSFLAGNGLPARWAGRERFVVLETGFGAGHNFVAFWQAWRQDPRRCSQLVFVSIEQKPPTRAELARAHADSEPVQALLAAWPPLTFNLHPIDFEAGRVRLLLAWGDPAALLRELVLQADAFCVDGLAAAGNTRLVKTLGRRSAPGATAVARGAAAEMHAGLTTAGFRIAAQADHGGPPDITCARYEPRHAVAAAAAQPHRREAIVVGAGLAGAAVARALVDEGWQVSVLDRRSSAAAETSGNAGGLFHGTVHGDDGVHARLLRAAALHAQRVLQPAIHSGAVAGQLQGLLRLETRPLAQMQDLIRRQQLPADWVQALDVHAASAAAGVPLPGAAWFYPGGGWVAPGELVAHWLRGLHFVGGCDVQTLQAAGDGWQLRDSAGALLAQAAVVVLANAGDAARLLGAHWPLQRLRGQVSGWAGTATPLRLPLAGDGYALPLSATSLLCGASSHADDDDAAVRDSDHRDNFDRLQRLTGLMPPADHSRWTGRVGWRITADDRLPIAGPVPLPEPGPRRDQARLWPRCRGLFVCTALGGRGITLAPLLGRLVAAQVAGSPLPLEQNLVDAIDPVRWRVRAARRGAAQG